jgi:16S rRNA (cytosine967-C5)-methyltransferase
MGARDRGFVAEAVYGVLHRRRKVEWLMTGADLPAEPGALSHVLAWLVGFGAWNAEDLEHLGFGAAGVSLASRREALAAAELPFAITADLPDALAERFVAEFGEEEAPALASGLHEPASLDLRVNSILATREQAAEKLASDGFAAEPTPFSPDGLRCQGRKPLQSTEVFREGWIEVQDEGSQLISLLLEPKRGERIADFCAGAGGKSLHLATLMGNRGGLYAFDISGKRLKALRERLRRAHLDNIRLSEISGENDPHLERYRGSMARVLVDAPCSNTGTVRRNPDVLWRALDLDTLTALQRRILDAAAKLVAPGGRLVYATCSLLREETEGVVAGFLAANADFRTVPANEIFQRLGVKIPDAVTPEGFMRLLPHRHHTDGFRAAVLERKQDG